MLAGLDRGHHRPIMVGHLDADRDQVDIGMSGELFAIGKRQRRPVMPCRRFCGVQAARANGGDLEVRKRLQGRDMGDRRKPALRTGPDDADADFAACGHDLPLHFFWATALRGLRLWMCPLSVPAVGSMTALISAGFPDASASVRALVRLGVSVTW